MTLNINLFHRKNKYRKVYFEHKHLYIALLLFYATAGPIKKVFKTLNGLLFRSASKHLFIYSFVASQGQWLLSHRYQLLSQDGVVHSLVIIMILNLNFLIQLKYMIISTTTPSIECPSRPKLKYMYYSLALYWVNCIYVSTNILCWMTNDIF